jgi:hypothetical protein
MQELKDKRDNIKDQIAKKLDSINKFIEYISLDGYVEILKTHQSKFDNLIEDLKNIENLIQNHIDAYNEVLEEKLIEGYVSLVLNIYKGIDYNLFKIYWFDWYPNSTNKYSLFFCDEKFFKEIEKRVNCILQDYKVEITANGLKFLKI